MPVRRCQQCGYDLSGLDSPTGESLQCPECSAIWHPRQQRRVIKKELTPRERTIAIRASIVAFAPPLLGIVSLLATDDRQEVIRMVVIWLCFVAIGIPLTTLHFFPPRRTDSALIIRICFLPASAAVLMILLLTRLSR